MECYTHEGRVAVGTCRACLKGVCRACAVDLGMALACRERCEAAARDLIAMLQQGVRQRGMVASTRKLWLGMAVVAAGVGVFVVVFGLSLPAYQSIGLLGLPFLALAALLARVARGVPA